MMIELFDMMDFDSGMLAMRAPEFAHKEAQYFNKKLNAYIQTLEKVYGDIKLGSYHHKPLFWSVDEKEDSTHSCRIIDIERLRHA